MDPVRRRFTSLLAALLLVATSTSMSRGVNPTDDDADSVVVGAAMSFRSAFGYSTDLELVGALERNPAANRKYSVALTAAEVADMDIRMAIQSAMEPLVEYAHSFPETFGGIYVDQAAGGVFYFSFTSDIEARQSVLESMAPAGVDIRYRTVTLTEAEVDALVNRASRDLEFHQGLGIAVHDVRSDTARNGVDIFIEPFSNEIAHALEVRYGDGIRVVPGTAPELTACVNRDNCDGPPIMAGVSNDWGCSVGFGVHALGNVNLNRRFLTAGHCVKQVVDLYGWSGWEWFHHNTSLGLSTGHSWSDYSKADAGTMGNVSSTIHSRRVMYDVTPSWYTTSSTQPATSDYPGFAICQSGQTSGFQCGTILSINTTPCYDPTPPCGGSDAVHMANQRQANYFVQIGDSGGPVVNSSNRNMAVGLQSGRDSPNVAYYSHIGHVQTALQQYVRITD